MKILAIMWGTCSTAALMINGEIVGCVSEERFSRRKNDEGYPRLSIEYLLEYANLSPSDLDLVVFGGERFDVKGVLYRKYSNWSVRDRLREQYDYWQPLLYEKRGISFSDAFKDKLDAAQYPGKWDDVINFLKNGKEEESAEFLQDFRRRVVIGHLHIEPAKVVFARHHRGHAYYAYYGSPLRDKKTLILTADAWGDEANASVNVAECRQISRVSSSNNLILARLYRYITLLLGMKPDEHEYKVMGLAAYANPDYIQEPLKMFRNTMYVDGMGFNYHAVPPDLYFFFKEKLEGFRFDAIAGALQEYTQEILLQWARNCLSATGARQLCFGGGVGMNVKAMMEIARLPEVDNIFVCPSPADESLAIGAAYVVMHDQCVRQGVDPGTVLRPLANAYLGPVLDEGGVKQSVHQLGESGRYVVVQGADADRVACAIASGKVVGRCVGRSEFGARALGNRSILGDPRDPGVVKRINEKVKSRDFWMPFAPSIMEERASQYLLNPKDLLAPYMTIAFETTASAHRDLCAALHQADRTCRPQLVSKAANPEYHALLCAYERRTGVGGLLNTSFNIHGEPIVQTAADAVDVLERSGLDALVLDDYFIEKK